MIFQRVSDNTRNEAYQWHRGFAASNDHLFPRTRKIYDSLVAEGSVWCAIDIAKDFCGMAYYAEDGNAWEIGGLMVAESEQGNGIGSILMRLALGTVLTELNPLQNDERIIAHVHEANQMPRPLIEKALLFQHVKRVSIPGDKLPGLKTDENGFVCGDEFELSIPKSLVSLASWCENWNGSLKDGTSAIIELPRRQQIAEWAADIREIIEEL